MESKLYYQYKYPFTSLSSKFGGQITTGYYDLSNGSNHNRVVIQQMAGVMMSQLSFVTSHHRAADERKLYLGLFGNLGLWGLFQQLLRPEQQAKPKKIIVNASSTT